MSTRLRLVYAAEAVPPRRAGQSLTSLDELEPLLRQRLHEHFGGEISLRGHGAARICLFEGKIAWIRDSGHPEHLGDVLRRELGISAGALRRAIDHCRKAGLQLGEGMLALGLVRPHELRECLYQYLSDQLWEILAWPGPVVVEQSEWPHRYDHAFAFELEELLWQPAAPTLDEQAALGQLVQRCRERLAGLQLVCVVEGEEGLLLHGPPAGDAAAHDLLGLCLVGLRRLAGNRVTRGEGPAQGMVLTAPDACVVLQHIDWHPGWLLVLGGVEPPGRLLSVAKQAVRATAPG